MKKNSRLKAISTKVPENILKQLRANADRFAEGNLSAWLRHAGLYHKPKKGEKIVVPRTIPDFF